MRKKKCWFCGETEKEKIAPSDYIINKETGESKPICWSCCEKGMDQLDSIVERRMKRKKKEKI